MTRLLWIILCLCLAAGCAKEQAPYDYGMLDLETRYKSLAQLKADSPLIAEVRVTDEWKTVSYGQTAFAITPLVVQRVYKGDTGLEQAAIDLLELASMAITRDKGDGTFLLFLRPYDGPIVKDAYVIAGVYQGKFRIDSGRTLHYDAARYGGTTSFQPEFVKTPLTALAELLR